MQSNNIKNYFFMVIYNCDLINENSIVFDCKLLGKQIGVIITTKKDEITYHAKILYVMKCHIKMESQQPATLESTHKLTQISFVHYSKHNCCCHLSFTLDYHDKRLL